MRPSRVQNERITTLKKASHLNGPVLYWMCREQRVADNWSLLHAQDLALDRKVELHVAFALPPSFLGAGLRQYDFMLNGLKDVEKSLKSKNIPFHLLQDDPPIAISQWCQEYKCSTVVTDFAPLRIHRQWLAQIQNNISCGLEVVDSHNVVPCTYASPKREYGAYTLRPKIHKLLPEFLQPIAKLKKMPERSASAKKTANIHWEQIYKDLQVDRSITPVNWLKAGEKKALSCMRKYIKESLQLYSEHSNNPVMDCTSKLSPYLNFGHLSSQRLALEVGKANIAAAHSDAFLEQVIVRKEIADNFCWYEEKYDDLACLPQWAKTTLQSHERDLREPCYKLKDFEQAQTHDPLWNAAQKELLKSGWMHGYMRMYWAKKILEWSPSPAKALKWANTLNDRYQLDGRDPNGYVGTIWSIGGIHDRAWGERPIFGKIRTMTSAGCARKFDTNKYIELWL
ncbi:MAG: deoxyribodipyrimidine photo-lyase [Planctomycetes bacterium]|nr:deoxyribodipyrimidine photo-lyase [Planctomycetota bacterium]